MAHGTCNAMVTNPAQACVYACVVVVAGVGVSIYGTVLLHATQSVAPTGRIANDIIVAAVIFSCW